MTICGCENGWVYATPGGWIPCPRCGGSETVAADEQELARMNRLLDALAFIPLSETSARDALHRQIESAAQKADPSVTRDGDAGEKSA